MKKISKKIFFIFVFSCFMINISFANEIILRKNELKLSDDLNFIKIDKVKDNKAYGINILEFDFEDYIDDLELFFNKNGFEERKIISEINEDGDYIALINGDLFSMEEKSFSIGPMIKDSKILSTPHYKDDIYASFFLNEKEFLMDYIIASPSIFNKEKDKELDINAINKPSQYFGNIVLYTNEYVKNTPGANETYHDLCEVIISDDEVKEIRVSKPSYELLEDEYVILAGGDNSKVLQEFFEVGDEVKLNSNFKIKDEDIDAANYKLGLGGVSILLKDGEKTEITKKIAGVTSRTAIGINDDKILLIVIDGKNKNFKGLNEEELQDLLLEFDCEDAIALDGGGSSQMMVLDNIENRLTKERKILNGIAIKRKEDLEDFDEINGFVDKEIALVGEKIKIKLSFLDEDENNIDVDFDDLDLDTKNLKGDFNIVDDSINKYIEFIPTKETDEGKIIIEYKREEIEFDIKVLKKKENENYFNLIKENETMIELENQENEKPKTEEEKINDENKEQNVADLLLDDEESEEKEDDDTDEFENENLNNDEKKQKDLDDSFDIAFIGNMDNSKKTLLNNLVIQKYEKKLSEFSDEVFVLGNENKNFLKGNENNFKNNIQVFDRNENKFIVLDNSNSNLYSKGNQLELLKDELDDDDYDNIFIILSSKDELNFELENMYIRRILDKNSKDKNINIIYNSNKLNSYAIDNINYFEIPQFDYFNSKNYKNDYKYLLISIDKDDIKYTYLNILDI
ncbi:MAG: phosphodiester glycosidase family protein [Peptostreptococcaceae bacterium]|nr:phosphodiester glycosidase family protein [Peptostreptococcaceae bacterium]